MVILESSFSQASDADCRVASKSQPGSDASRLAIAFSMLTEDMPILARTRLLENEITPTVLPSPPAFPTTAFDNGAENLTAK